jgi:hypothetical protein
MIHELVLKAGKQIFNFHPDAEFLSITDMIAVARVRTDDHRRHMSQLATLAANMAYIIDGEKGDE